MIYQSALIENVEEKKKFIDYVSDYEYNKLGMKKPDIVIFLTAPFEIVNKLRKERPDNEGIIIYKKSFFQRLKEKIKYIIKNKRKEK